MSARAGVHLCSGWKGETDLDIEMFHTLAPGAHIYVVATPVAETLGIHGFPQMMKAIDYLLKHQTVQVISMSLSATEETFKSNRPDQEPRPDVRAREGSRRARSWPRPATQGATGPKKHGGVYNHRVVGFPASDPLVTAVGGTVLHFVDGHRTSPTASSSSPVAGSRTSTSRPSWQDGVKGITKSTMRSIPTSRWKG